MNCTTCVAAAETEDRQVEQLLKNEITDETQSSDTSIDEKNTKRRKTKKSLFATLIKKKRTGRPKMKITKKIETCSTIRFGTESVSSDQEVAQYQVSAHPKKQKGGFFKKIIKSSNNCLKEEIEEETCGDLNYTELKALTMNKQVPTTYIPKYNLKVITGMHELHHILHNLNDTEKRIVHLLKRYINDQEVQNQLIATSSEFFALQYDAKGQMNVLADKMWLQQIELHRIQDYNLQKRLTFLVKTNRNLETQVETLKRHCEKLAAKKNAYPNRFLRMKSFGKVYARQLVENNKKLHKKLVALTGVISDFEEELIALQHQRDVSEEEKRSFRAQVYELEGEVEKLEQANQLDKRELHVRMSHQSDAINEAASTIELIFRDLQDFEYQLAEFSIKIEWPQLQFENPCLVAMIYQLRASIGQLLMTMTTAYKNMSVSVEDVTKLRNTNARLQENLHKSTSELDSLSKKFASSESADLNALETQCRKLEQEVSDLNVKLETMTEQNTCVRGEMCLKKKLLTQTESSLNELTAQNQCLVAQIDDLVQSTSQIGAKSLTKEFNSNQDKIDYLKLRFSQIVADQRHLAERCNSLDEENQSLQQIQQAYEQDLTTLQNGLTLLTAENESMKKQLATEHQTVLTLQNERLKYLEEKNLLKTIFHHLKGEVSRIQQLEGAVADMTKETNRLSLVAEFNKQLGEQLRDEVETKENTISELRQSLEKLSHLQLDSDKEKMTLCAQLSEVVSVKDKLSDCLEMELKKSMHLDESKKKLETTTKSQLKIYEEMQKNERAALKELLKDFKNVIKQRDCLLLMQEESKKNLKEMEKQYHGMRKQHDELQIEASKKEEEVKRVVEQMHCQEEQWRQQEDDYKGNFAKYEKTIKKLEKLLGQMRNEKTQLEESNTYLKNNLQKLQSELDEAREQASIIANEVVAKTTEAATLDSELTTYKNDLQMLTQEHGKVMQELEFLKQMNQQKAVELKETISSFTTKESKYLESQDAIHSKEQEISNLGKVIVEKEGEIKRLEQECNHLKKQIDDQTKIMINYENHLVVLQDAQAAKQKIEKELADARLEQATTNTELENLQKENETLRNELKVLLSRHEKERAFFKNQTNEIMIEYDEHKANIEEEIDSISLQLRIVNENLRLEKGRFEELSNAYEDLRVKHIELKEQLSAEVAAHQESQRRIEGMETFVNAVVTERDNLQQQVHVLLLEINEEKEANHHLSDENKTVQLILEQGKQQYAAVLSKNAALEEEINRLRFEMKTIANTTDSSKGEIDKVAAQLAVRQEELKSAKEMIECLKRELADSQKTVFELKEEYFKMQQQVTTLEFKNCELTLQLHESQGKLETERNFFKELKENPQTAHAQRNSPLAPSDCGEPYF